MTSYEGDAVDWSVLVGGWVAWVLQFCEDLSAHFLFFALAILCLGCSITSIPAANPSTLLSSLLQWLSSCDRRPLRVGAGSMLLHLRCLVIRVLLYICCSA